MEEENKNVGAEATTESTGADNATETKIDYAELMKTDKALQSFVDSQKTQAMKTAIDNAKVKWEEDKTEAEKLAKMKNDEKLQYQLDKSNKEKDDALAELNAYKLEKEAVKIASEKGLDVSLLDLIDFKTATAESINSNIENLNSVFNKAVEKAVNERLKEDTPTTKVGDKGSQPKSIPTIF